MKPTILIFAVCVIAVARLGWSQTASENNGKVVFDKWCAPCHGAVAPKEGMFGGGALPGTAALTVKYKGRLPAVLEERADLRPNVIASVVRGGLFGMPITRKTEVSDAELQDIVGYLTRNRKP